VVAQGANIEIMREVLASIHLKRLDKDYNQLQRIEVLYYVTRGYNFINQVLKLSTLSYDKAGPVNSSHIDKIMKMCKTILDSYKEVLDVFRSGVRQSTLEMALATTLKKIAGINELITQLLTTRAFTDADRLTESRRESFKF
jgi:hypothetical protein